MESWCSKSFKLKWCQVNEDLTGEKGKDCNKSLRFTFDTMMEDHN